jgi:hypothetical protein
VNNQFKNSFYLKPFLLISTFNMLFFVVFGMYFEEYESAMSSFIQGIYTKPCTSYYDINIHYLIMWIYEYLNRFFPNVQVYGIVLVSYNFISLTVAGLVLYRILKININKYNEFVFLSLYFIICINNFINLSTDRVAFIGIASIIAFIESRRFEKKKIGAYLWSYCVIVIIILSLIRMEVVLLFSILYILTLLLFKRFYLGSLMPMIISLLLFLSFNFAVKHLSKESIQVHIYKEKEILDRKNINYIGLDKLQTISIEALTEYGILDKEHFTFKFYDTITYSKSKNLLQGIIDGLNFRSFINTLKSSIAESHSSLYLILFYVYSSIVLIVNSKKFRRKFYILFVFLFVFPILICFHTIVPLRFLVPYYTILIVLNLLIYISENKINVTIVLFLITCLCFISIHSFTDKRQYLEANKRYLIINNKFLALKKEYEYKAPIIIHNFDFLKFFPVNPVKKIHKQPALFLNFFYYNAYDFYLNAWKETCDCNPLSLKEKVDYIVNANCIFLIDEHSFLFMQKYFKEVYKINLEKTDLGDFDNTLKICKLNYNINISVEK